MQKYQKTKENFSAFFLFKLYKTPGKMKALNILFISLILISCKSGNQKPQAQTAAQPAAKQEFKEFELTELWRTDSTLRIPESVIYNESNKTLYVSNINSKAKSKTKDAKNGFISQLSLDGKITQLHWVDSLKGPKGMGIVGNNLYVADIDELVEIDINNRKITNRIPIKDAKMLNDVTTGPNGEVYVSDSEGNKIYEYYRKEVSEWLSFGLKGPNGLLVAGDSLILASSGSMDLNAINLVNRNKTLLTGGINKGDGVAPTGEKGHFLVSDWEGEVFLIHPDNTKVSLLNLKDKNLNTADIWFIPDQNMLLVPTFNGNIVIAYKLVQKSSV